jgi:hypothetical protein
VAKSTKLRLCAHVDSAALYARQMALHDRGEDTGIGAAAGSAEGWSCGAQRGSDEVAEHFPHALADR